MAEGLGFDRIGEEPGEDLALARHVRPGVSGRDDMWGHPVSV
jgi:hypothetical protein